LILAWISPRTGALGVRECGFGRLGRLWADALSVARRGHIDRRRDREADRGL